MPSKGNDAWERRKRSRKECPTTGGPHQWRQMPLGITEELQYRCDKCAAIVTASRDVYGAISLDVVSETSSGREFSYPEIRYVDDRKLTDPYPVINVDDLGGAIHDMTLTGPPRPREQTTLRRITSMEAMQLILDEIRNSADPFAAAGVWLTRFTNGVAEITREEE